MIPLRAYAGRRVSVLALSAHALAAARALASGGAAVSVWDSCPVRRDQAARLGLSLEDPTTRDWSDLALVVTGQALASDDPAPRLTEMAQSLDIPVISAEALMLQGLGQAPCAGFVAGLGRTAPAALALAGYLLRQTGHGVIGPDITGAPRAPGPSSVILTALSSPAMLSSAAGSDASPTGLCLLDGAGASADFRSLAERARGPVVLSADDPATRRLSIGRTAGACLVSGRSTLARGVFVAAGRLFDATGGAARSVVNLADAPGLRLSHPLAVAAGLGLARKLGAGFDDVRDVIAGYAGLPGHGARLGSLGPIDVSDWSQAVTPRAVADALTSIGPVIWLGGPAADPSVAALLEASGRVPAGVVLTGDRRKARRALGRLCPVQVERDLTAALARAIHAALRAGPGARIVYAPGGTAPDDISEQISASLDNLVQRASHGDAA